MDSVSGWKLFMVDSRTGLPGSFWMWTPPYSVGERYPAQHAGLWWGKYDSPVREYHNDIEDWSCCSCGFYALPTAEKLFEYLFRYANPQIDNQGFTLFAGPVLLDGWVVEGEKGFRGEYMTVLPFEYVLQYRPIGNRTAKGGGGLFVSRSKLEYSMWKEVSLQSYADYRRKKDCNEYR